MISEEGTANMRERRKELLLLKDELRANLNGGKKWILDSENRNYKGLW